MEFLKEHVSPALFLILLFVLIVVVVMGCYTLGVVNIAHVFGSATLTAWASDTQQASQVTADFGRDQFLLQQLYTTLTAQAGEFIQPETTPIPPTEPLNYVS